MPNQTSETFIDHVRREVIDIRSDYPGLSSDGDAFAVWAVSFVHHLTLDEALECSTTSAAGPGDGGLDAVVVDDGDGVVYLVQAKYADNPATATFDASPAAELQVALNRLLSPLHSDQLGGAFAQKAAMVRDALAGGADLVLQTIVFGKETPGLVSSAETARTNNPDLRVESDIWTVQRLEAEQLQRTVVQDLRGVSVPINISGDLVALPCDGVDGMTDFRVAVLDGQSLAAAAAAHGATIVEMNVRYQLRRSKINDEIARTATTKALQPRFLILNNGLTIICDALVPEAGRVVLENPQIVNGAQTALTLADRLAELRPGDVQVLARIMVIDRKRGRELAQEISESTNRQNPVTSADLKANDPAQIRIDRDMRLLQPAWFYERKRNSFAALTEAEKKNFVRSITKEDLAQRYRAMLGEPAKAVTNKGAVFDQAPLYGRIFDETIPVQSYLLAHELYGYFYGLLHKSRANARALVYEGFSEEDRANLSRARAQWATHCTALTHYLIVRRYGVLSKDRAMAIVAEIRNRPDNYRPLLSLTVMTIIKWAGAKRAKAIASEADFSLRDEFESVAGYPEICQEADAMVHWYKSQTFDLLPD